jgi:hypothetical protein
MGKEMRTLYIEGLAAHGGPESCAGICEGVGEALTGVRAGQVLSREITVRGADMVKLHGRQHRQRRFRESLVGPARSETLCMYGVSMRENREVPCLSVWLITGRAVQRTLRR